MASDGQVDAINASLMLVILDMIGDFGPESTLSIEQDAAIKASLKLALLDTIGPESTLSIEQNICLILFDNNRKLHDKQCQLCARARAHDSAAEREPSAVTCEKQQCRQLMRKGCEYHDEHCQFCAGGRIH